MAIAAPDLIEWVPMLLAWRPSLFSPARVVAILSCLSMALEEMYWGSSESCVLTALIFGFVRERQS